MSALLLSQCDFGPKGQIQRIPKIPTPTAPFNRSVDQPNAVYLEWTDPSETDGFHVQVSTRSDFLTLVVEQQNVVLSILPIKELQLGLIYFWRVRAFNEAGFSEWSSTWSFTSSMPATLPSVPSLVYPDDSVLDLGKTVIFRWMNAEGARFYHLQVSLERDYFSREADMNTIVATTQSVSELVFDYIYFWRVRGRNAAGYGPWSPTWTVVIGGEE